MTRGQRGDDAAPGFETRDLRPRRIVYALIGLFALIATGAGAVSALMSITGVEAPRPVPSAFQEVPAPGLQATPGRDAAAVRAVAEAKLTGYAWMDRGRGLVRIPIERAMELLAEQGWPDEPGGEP